MFHNTTGMEIENLNAEIAELKARILILESALAVAAENIARCIRDIKQLKDSE